MNILVWILNWMVFEAVISRVADTGLYLNWDYFWHPPPPHPNPPPASRLSTLLLQFKGKQRVLIWQIDTVALTLCLYRMSAFFFFFTLAIFIWTRWEVVLPLKSSAVVSLWDGVMTLAQRLFIAWHESQGAKVTANVSCTSSVTAELRDGHQNQNSSPQSLCSDFFFFPVLLVAVWLLRFTNCFSITCKSAQTRRRFCVHFLPVRSGPVLSWKPLLIAVSA